MHIARYSRTLAALLLILLSWALQAAPISAVRVCDADGNALLARVTVVRPGDPYPDQRVFFTDANGRCSLAEVAAGPATLRVTHGPEWSIEESEATIDPASEGSAAVTLQRLYDLEAKGYFQGDCHMHSTNSDGKQPAAEVALHCRCEGLDFAFLTDHETVAGHAEFLGAAADGFLPLPGQEITTVQGHILGLGITQVVSRDVTNGAEDMKRIFRQVHEQGGLAVVAHPNVPGMAYSHWAVEGYDMLEILNGSAPPYMGLFDMVQCRLRWHGLLSEGKRIPVIGNSDNHDNTSEIVMAILRNPEEAAKRDRRIALMWNLPNRDQIIIPWAMKGLHLGFYRNLAKPEEMSLSGVLGALKAGRNVVTNGPILVARVNGADPGGEITGPEAKISFDAVCNRGLAKAVVCVDGKQAATVPLSGSTALGCEATVSIEGAKWLTVECYGTWPEFATTNAWYVGQ